MKKILIVEDDQDFSFILSKKFAAEKFSVITAFDGREGLEMAIKEKPDLILLDITMPVMDGMTMMSKLREDEWGKTVYIILLTNLSADENILKEMIKDEPLFYLVKSQWSLNDIMAKVREILKV